MKASQVQKLTGALLTALMLGALALAGCSGGGAPAGGGASAGKDSVGKVTITVDITAAVDAGDPTAVALSKEKGGDTYSVEADIPEGATVLSATQGSGLVVATTSSSFGVMVDSIDGLATGVTVTSGWVFTLNGDEVNIGADACEVKDGDVIVWQYVTSWE